MLAEFALTPSVFDEGAHADKDAWREQLRELGTNMFPRVAAWPVIVSNLYESSWHVFALQTVKSISDQRARLLCQGILDNAAKTLVARPALAADWPGEDSVAWGQEAIDSHGAEPIERIVACRAAHTVLAKSCKFIRCIDEVQDSGFWQGISADWSPPMKIADQVQALRKLCVHSDFLCLISPDIKGGSDDEADFASEVIRSSFARPAGFPPPEIEIHTEGPHGNPAESDYASRLATRVSNVSQSLKRHIPAGQSIRLVVWPKLLDRVLVAGVYAEVASGGQQRSPRWGISMSHIARKPDERKADFFTEW
jgi:hypothetical protein